MTDEDASIDARAPEIPQLELPPDLGRSLAQGHPWVYRDHVPRAFRAEAGSWVRIRAGATSAVALWDPDSPLALRIFSRTSVPDESWFATKIKEAYDLRERTGVTAVASAYRLVAGEGDGLPGIVVDRYGPFAVIVLDTSALAPYIDWVVSGLKRIASFHGIARRNRKGGGPRLEILFGRPPPDHLVIEEHGARFYADLHRGQKTGLFLDQRENRRYIQGLAAGRTALNLFGYTGGFSVCAALGGALHVTTVDVAEDAVSAAAENFRLNGLDPNAHDFVASDVFEYLGIATERGQRFDVVICDPPSFARSRGQRGRASEAYVRLHAAAIAVTKPGGFYAASSCSTQVSHDAFHASLRAGASRAHVRLQVFHDAGHAADHPISIGHPEGRYLKFVVARVEDEI